MIDLPRISIVTPSYNQAAYLEVCIQSVLSQQYPRLEFIIIDGGSSDNSVEIIKKYEKHLTYWVSEKDKGQSHAINKGLSRCTGDIFNWLCSDDFLEPGSLWHIGEVFMNNPGALCYSGKLRKFTSSGTRGFYGNMLQQTWEDTLRIRVLKQPAVFFSMKAIKQMGPVNETLHYCMDADWLWKFFFLFSQANIFEDDRLIAHYLIHEVSKSGSQGDAFTREDNTIIHYFARSKKQDDLAEILMMRGIKDGYTFPDELLERVPAKVVRRIVMYYLLRNCTLIYTRRDFEIAKAFSKIVFAPNTTFTSDEQQYVSFLHKYVKSYTWNRFLIVRWWKWHVKKQYLSPQ
jgi:glycosyltransferase involved in cell wall biosynthesis